MRNRFELLLLFSARLVVGYLFAGRTSSLMTAWCRRSDQIVEALRHQFELPLK